MSRGMAAAFTLTVNGEARKTSAATIAQLVGELELKPDKVAVELNGAIVPRSTLGAAALADGDVLEIVHFVGGGDHAPVSDDSWSVAGRTFRSRLIVGTGCCALTDSVRRSGYSHMTLPARAFSEAKEDSFVMPVMSRA